MEKENTFRDSLTVWFGNASNRITRIFTGEICLIDENGDSECINKGELRQLKSLMNASAEVAATCTDGIMNQDETGIDTGGVCAPDPSDISALSAAKATAEGLISTNAPESENPGDHMIGALATLTEANTTASATTADTQSVVDAQVTVLNTAILVYNTAIVPTP